MKSFQQSLTLLTNALLICLMLCAFNASAQHSPILEHSHSDQCKSICYVTPDSMVRMQVYLPFDSVQTTQVVGVKDGLVYYQGDIILGEYNDLIGQNFGLGINGYRWTNSTVRYYINAGFANWQRNQIIQAANDVESKTDICFEQISAPSGNYVNVVQGGGCSSFVGMRGGGQALTLAANCGLAATIHEFLHAAGMWHEQSRSDRGNHITINWGNIMSGMESNFHVQYSSTLYGSYDLNSIMHYNSYAFSSNGQPTITKLNGSTLPYIYNMSAGDIATINAMYNACGGGGSTCVAPTAAQNYTSSIAQNTARLYCTAAYNYRQWRYKHASASAWTTTNYTHNISYVNITGLAAANNYVWQSRVWCGNQWSAWSVNESFTTLGGGNACVTPTASENTTTGITTTGAVLNCSTNKQYKQYQYRASTTGAWTQTNYTSNQNTKAISGLSASTAYYWQSRVWCGSTWSAWSTSEVFTTNGGGGGGTCGAASGLYYYGLTAKTLSLDWSDASGATSYQVYYWNGSAWVSFATVYTSNVNVTGLNGGSTYCFLVGSFCGGTLGGYSTYICVTTPNALGQNTAPMGVGISLPNEGPVSVALDVTDATMVPVPAAPIPSEGELLLDMTISPNPTTVDQPITLEVNSSSEEIEVVISNINGSRVFQRGYSINPGNNKIQLEPLANAGMYFITVQSNGQIHTKKMMILE